jgi:hypothetical protein
MSRSPSPKPCLRATDGWKAELAWSYDFHTATWRFTRDIETRFLKVTRDGWEPSLAAERAGSNGRSAASRSPAARRRRRRRRQVALTYRPPWTRRDRSSPRPIRRSWSPVLARGLRSFHETRVDDCAFEFTLDVALDLTRRRVEGGLVVPDTDFHDEHRHFTPRRALERLEAHRPQVEDLALCHGDYCPPNMLIDDEGRITGYLDLGELGVADRWWDLAVATWSVTWNLGPGWEELFLDAYGVRRDSERNAYYRLMYDMVS